MSTKTRKTVALTLRQFEVLDEALRITLGYCGPAVGLAAEDVRKERMSVRNYLHLKVRGVLPAQGNTGGVTMGLSTGTDSGGQG